MLVDCGRLFCFCLCRFVRRVVFWFLMTSWFAFGWIVFIYWGFCLKLRVSFRGGSFVLLFLVCFCALVGVVVWLMWLGQWGGVFGLLWVLLSL